LQTGIEMDGDDTMKNTAADAGACVEAAEGSDCMEKARLY
jgi:hypothetical protein